MKDLAKTWLSLLMLWENRIMPGKKNWIFFFATFVTDLGFPHILASSSRSLQNILEAFYPYMGIIVFCFQDAEIRGQNWQKHPTTYT